MARNFKQILVEFKKINDFCYFLINFRITLGKYCINESLESTHRSP